MVVGETTLEVPVTVPTPLLIESVGLGVPVVVHERVEDCPDVMVDELAVKLWMVGVVPPIKLKGCGYV